MQNLQFAASGIVLRAFILMASICCCVAARRWNTSPSLKRKPDISVAMNEQRD
jgi:hypothetical protein